jgi:hypothetical protein
MEQSEEKPNEEECMLGGMGQIAILIFVHVLNHESTAFGNIHGTASEQTLQQISKIDAT